MNRWAHLLPTHIRESFRIHPLTSFTFESEKEFFEQNKCYDPDNDPIMLRAKVTALTEYVEMLLNVIEQYEKSEGSDPVRRYSDPGIYAL